MWGALSQRQGKQELFGYVWLEVCWEPKSGKLEIPWESAREEKTNHVIWEECWSWGYECESQGMWGCGVSSKNCWEWRWGWCRLEREKENSLAFLQRSFLNNWHYGLFIFKFNFCLVVLPKNAGYVLHKYTYTRDNRGQGTVNVLRNSNIPELSIKSADRQLGRDHFDWVFCNECRRPCFESNGKNWMLTLPRGQIKGQLTLGLFAASNNRYVLDF